MEKTSIEWTETTWNPVTGCNKVSAGCKYCYAERIAKWQQLEGSRKYRNGFEVTLHPHMLRQPYHWDAPRVVFVNSMSDLLHKDVPISYIRQVFKVMNDNPQHIFQILTKRSNTLKMYDQQGLLNWSPNIWMGVSVENEKVVHRIDDLRATKAHVKFLSLEPLLGPLPNLDLTDIDWAIVGGESGPVHRPIKEDWVWDIKQQCDTANVAFFFKQWGGRFAKSGGKLLKRKTYLKMPKDYYVRQQKWQDHLDSKQKQKSV